MSDSVLLNYRLQQTSNFQHFEASSKTYISISCSNAMPDGAACVFLPTNAARYQVLHFKTEDPVIIVGLFVLSSNDSISMYPVVDDDVIPNCVIYQVKLGAIVMIC